MNRPWKSESNYQPIKSWHDFYNSWIWYVLIIGIVLIIVLWLFYGGQSKDSYLGLLPAITDKKPSEVIDADTMIILGIKDPLSPSDPENTDSIYSEYDYTPYPSNYDSNNQYHQIHPINSDQDTNYASPNIVSPNIVSPNISNDLITPRYTNSNRSGSNRSNFLPSSSQYNESINTTSPTNSTHINSPERPPSSQRPTYQDLNNLGLSEKIKNSSHSRGETICREWLEQYYGKPFPTIRPDFLINPLTGRNLELDGYNSEIEIAFEYNGIQHYQFPNKFHRTVEDFQQQVRRDNYKKEACQLSGVYLIQIPYLVPPSQIPEYIYNSLPHRVRNSSE